MSRQNQARKAQLKQPEKNTEYLTLYSTISCKYKLNNLHLECKLQNKKDDKQKTNFSILKFKQTCIIPFVRSFATHLPLRSAPSAAAYYKYFTYKYYYYFYYQIRVYTAVVLQVLTKSQFAEHSSKQKYEQIIVKLIKHTLKLNMNNEQQNKKNNEQKNV